MNWTPEQTEFARKLWREGMSAAQIARRMRDASLARLSRNAVIGRMYRIGELSPTRNFAGRPRAPIHVRPAAEHRSYQNRLNARQVRPTNPNPIGGEGVSGMKARVEREAKAPKPAPVLIDASKHVTLMGLKPNHCRWPMTDHAPGQCEGTLFCAAPKAGEGSYCPCHTRRAVDGIKQSERDLVRSVRRYA